MFEHVITLLTGLAVIAAIFVWFMAIVLWLRLAARYPVAAFTLLALVLAYCIGAIIRA